MDRRCATADCGNPVSSELSSQFYCLDHFLLQCYGQLESFAREFRGQGKDANVLSCTTMWLPTEIATQVAVIGLRENNLSNAERSQLMDLLLWANSLIQEARRNFQWGIKE